MSELKRPNIRDYMVNKTDDDDDDEWYESYCADMEIYLFAEKTLKFKDRLQDNYSIDEDTWNNTPKMVQKIMMELHEKVENHEYLMEELHIWRENMPI
mgnify:CR=1 FL=1|tara:strand:- start:142 stop:435 length:294 start_codon:yes stop_codon:yes gene_type:complete